MEWYLALFSLVFGLGGGFFFSRASDSGIQQAKKLDAELKQTREELATYRTQVNDHFEKTAELVNTLTENYRAIYTHLADGAQNLCGGNLTKLEAMATPENLISADSAEINAGETAKGTTDPSIETEEAATEKATSESADTSDIEKDQQEASASETVDELLEGMPAQAKEAEADKGNQEQRVH